VTFLTPIQFHQKIRIGVCISRLGNKSIRMEYRLEETGSGMALATGSTVLVAYDYHTHQTVPIRTNGGRRSTHLKPWRRTMAEIPEINTGFLLDFLTKLLNVPLRPDSLNRRSRSVSRRSRTTQPQTITDRKGALVATWHGDPRPAPGKTARGRDGPCRYTRGDGQGGQVQRALKLTQVGHYVWNTVKGRVVRSSPVRDGRCAAQSC